MRALIFSLVLSIPAAHAASETIYGNGRSSGYCDGAFFSSCKNQLDNQAEQDGKRDTVMSCQLRGGRMNEWAAYCSTYCTPASLPYDAPRTYVSCSSSCSGSREKPDPAASN